MRKIILSAALLGSVYFANAQVGIGTADPASSAELDIVAKAGNKGILIPRVELLNITDFQMAGKSAESTSLLVFNKTEVKDLVPTGFYYWDGTKWNRIVGKEELDTVIKNLGDDITNITTKLEGDVKNLQAVINYILPSNPDNKDDDGTQIVTEKHTTIVYNPETKEMYYVTYDGDKYTTEQIDITKMVQGVETNTFFKEIKDANGKVTGYVYFNESTIVTAIDGETDATKIKVILDGLDAKTPGAISIDVKETVVNNIQEILESTVEIVIETTEGNLTFTTVEEYLQYITQFSEGNVIYKNISTDVAKPNWVLQYWDGSKYETINLTELVASVETKTNIKRSEATADKILSDYDKVGAPTTDNVKKGEIFYQYNNEEGTPDYINMTADIISSIKNNEEVKNEITNVLNQGGNVYFGDHDDNPATDEVFYKIVGGTRVKIELPASFMLEIINKYKDVIKKALGDHINNTTTIVNTGNTYNGKLVFLAKGTTTVGKVEDSIQYPSPLTTGTTIDLSKITGLTTIEDVLSISILKAGKAVASAVTDLVVTGNELAFAIGTGSFYTSLPYGDYEVVIEFTGNLESIPVTPQP